MKEAAVNSHVRLDAAQLGVNLWRNNVGLAWQGNTQQLNDGSILIKNPKPVRYGLCNDSKQLNEKIKSSDLIGITPITITPDMVGQTIGVFTAVETKESDWVYSLSNERTLAQSRFIDIVRGAGGYAGFARSPQEFRRIVGK